MVNGVPGRCDTGPQASHTIGRRPTNYYAAIDVSLELSSVCIVDATGKVVKEAKVRGFGLKVGKVTDKTFEARLRKLVTGHAANVLLSRVTRFSLKRGGLQV